MRLSWGFFEKLEAIRFCVIAFLVFESSLMKSLISKFVSYCGSSNVAAEQPCFLQFEPLEPRMLLSANLVIDYSFDTQGFFDDAQRRDAIEDVAAEISTRLGDTLDAIAPTGSNTWQAAFFHPGNGVFGNYVNNPTINADEIIVYVGGRDLGGPLGEAGPGGFSASGTFDWFDEIRQRGETGVANDTDFAPWGGSASFDSTANWNFSANLPQSNQHDFRSVAYHELFHVLGFATADSWTAQINSSNEFAGANVVAEHDAGGPVPLTPSASHFDFGTTEGGQEVALDPDLQIGTRKVPTALDWAALDDIGWDILDPAIGTVTVSGANLIVDGTDTDNLIEVRTATGGLRVLVDGFDHGVFASPTGTLVVNALDGNDEIRLQTTVTANTTLNGNDGDDVIRGGAGEDTINGGLGLDFAFGRDGDDVLFGNDGNDRLFGMNGNDELFGNVGDDNLTGGLGSDRLQGGSGADLLLGSGGNDLLFGQFGDDVVNGGADNDFLQGDAGADTILGLGGDDEIHGNDGNDDINAGAGNDTVFAGDGDDIVYGAGGIDILYGGLGNDMLFGEQANDRLFGEAGDDFLSGSTSNDFLRGGTGLDTIEGGGGDDQIFGDAGNDTLLGGTGSDTILGGANDDTLFGDGGSDDLFGEAGNDTITGGVGLDLLNGGLGIDTAVDTGELGEIDIEIS